MSDPAADDTQIYSSARDEVVCEVHPQLVLTVVVCGASGDLAKKKTFPALFTLHSRGFFPDTFTIIGYARSALTDSALRDRLRPYLKGDADKVDKFLQLITYISGPYDKPDGFQELQSALQAKEKQHGKGKWPVGRLMYLALPPPTYPEVCKGLKENASELGEQADSWLRVIVEKPFGFDLQTSEELADALGQLFPEEQLYRIDHYLGKELMQNMLVLRFANATIAPIWSAQHISNVQITFKEDFGTDGRGGYFDQFGILRDVMQNHLMQVLALVAMEKPVSLNADDIRDEKVKVLRCMRPVDFSEVVLGQYTAAGKQRGYLDDETVPKGSRTPTFAVCVLRIDNDRWAGVPFIMKAGKALNERKAEIRIQFKTPAAMLHGRSGGNGDALRNELVMRLQPDEAIYMKVAVKKPGLDPDVVMSELDLSYRERYSDAYIPDAYERLILDAVRGDQQHFVRRDELRAAWAIFTPLLHAIDAGQLSPLPYPAATRGPPQADVLISQAGFVKNREYVWSPRAAQVLKGSAL